MKDRYILPVFVPFEGCPFRCVYCDQKKITGHGAGNVTPESIKAGIERFLEYFNDKDRDVMLCFFGGTFTAIDHERQLLYLETANEYIKKNKIKEIGLSTRPDTINDSILNTLKRYNVTTIEIGAQSLVDRILEGSHRGHGFNDVKIAAEKVISGGFRCGIQLMPGLIGEDDASISETVSKLIDLRPHFIRIYPVIVIKGTQLEKMYENGIYIPLSLEKAVKYSEYMLREAVSNGIEVVRIGLHGGTQGITEENVAAGPFHAAFGELVLSEYIFQNVMAEISKYDKIDTVDIYVGKGMLSAAYGYKRQNMARICRCADTDDIRLHETGSGRYHTHIVVNKRGKDIVS